MTLAEKAGQLRSTWLGSTPGGATQTAGEPGDGIAPLHEELAGDLADWAELIRDGLGQLTRPFGTVPVTARDGAEALARTQREITAASRFGIPAIAHDECLAGFTAWTAAIFPIPLAWGASFRPAARAADGGADRHDHAGRRRPSGPRARPRRHGGPAVGTDRGDDRRGSLPGRDGRHRVRPRAGIDRAHLHPQALRRLLGLPRRPQPGARRRHRPADRGPAAPPVRDGHPAGRGALGDARLHRHRRHPDGLGPVPAVRRAAGHLGLHRDGGGRLLRHQLPGAAARRGGRSGPGGRAGAGRQASTSSCPPYGASARRSSARSNAERWPRPWSTGPRAGSCCRNANWACSTRPGTRARPPRTRASVDLAPPSARQIAGQLAEESIILLANDGTLPLSGPLSGGGRIAVVGPRADDPLAMLGCYSFPSHVGVKYPDLDIGVEIPTFLAALRQELPDRDIGYSPGCGVDDPDPSGIAAAAALAASSDICIAVVGDRSGLFGRGTSGEGCDAADLNLPGIQGQLLDAAARHRHPGGDRPADRAAVCARPVPGGGGGAGVLSRPGGRPRAGPGAVRRRQSVRPPAGQRAAARGGAAHHLHRVHAGPAVHGQLHRPRARCTRSAMACRTPPSAGRTSKARPPRCRPTAPSGSGSRSGTWASAPAPRSSSSTCTTRSRR